MTDARYIAAWTNPKTPIGSYVGFINVQVLDTGEYQFTIRPHESKDGNAVSIIVPAAEAVQTAHAINRAQWVADSAERAKRFSDLGTGTLKSAGVVGPGAGGDRGPGMGAAGGSAMRVQRWTGVDPETNKLSDNEYRGPASAHDYDAVTGR